MIKGYHKESVYNETNMQYIILQQVIKFKWIFDRWKDNLCFGFVFKSDGYTIFYEF